METFHPQRGPTLTRLKRVSAGFIRGREREKVIDDGSQDWQTGAQDPDTDFDGGPDYGGGIDVAGVDGGGR